MQEADDSDTPKAAPTEALMTAHGVLSWIAFKDARALDQILEVNGAWRWRNTDLDRTLASVDAILAGS